MDTLKEEIINCVNILKDDDSEVSLKYLQRAQEGSLTRDENPVTHFCVYFLPFNPATKQVFLVHHKKANKWISPGGHIDKGEHLIETLNREIAEELGVKNFFSALPHPFLITITPIQSTAVPDREHFDIWFLLKTDGSNFKVDPQEFYSTRWVTLREAEQIITDEANLKAIKKIKLNKSYVFKESQKQKRQEVDQSRRRDAFGHFAQGVGGQPKMERQAKSGG